MVIGSGSVYTEGIRKPQTNKKGAAVMKREHIKVCAVTDSRLRIKLSKNAEVTCARCGAKAHDKGSLCDPVAIEPDH